MVDDRAVNLLAECRKLGSERFGIVNPAELANYDQHQAFVRDTFTAMGVDLGCAEQRTAAQAGMVLLSRMLCIAGGVAPMQVIGALAGLVGMVDNFDE